VKTGKTPVLEGSEWRKLLESIPADTVRGLRDRALIATLTYSFARIGAALKMKVEDLRPRGSAWTIRLHEKGGKEHAMPCHHSLAEALHAYIAAAGGTVLMRGNLDSRKASAMRLAFYGIDIFNKYKSAMTSRVMVDTPITSDANSNIYFGGVEDGFSTAALTASVCPIPLNSNIYFGGVQDGFSNGALTVSVCPVAPNANIYFGGVQDGFSSVYLKTLLASCLLRIELASFTGSCVGGVKVLNWSTATESNNAYFTIEYSADGQNWQSAGTVAGAGNSSTTIDYSFTDAASRPGLTYYRLQQTDLDGKFTFSSILSVGSCTATGTDKLNIFPNPSSGPFSLSFDGDKTKIQAIEIYNVLGERIYYSGVWQSNIDLSDKPSATYFVHFITDTGTDVKEIVIKKY